MDLDLDEDLRVIAVAFDGLVRADELVDGVDPGLERVRRRLVPAPLQSDPTVPELILELDELKAPEAAVASHAELHAELGEHRTHRVRAIADHGRAEGVADARADKLKTGSGSSSARAASAKPGGQFEQTGDPTPAKRPGAQSSQCDEPERLDFVFDGQRSQLVAWSPLANFPAGHIEQDAKPSADA